MSGVANPDPESSAFLTPGSGIGFFQLPDPILWPLPQNCFAVPVQK
jgi:hypothetical protein